MDNLRIRQTVLSGVVTIGLPDGGPAGVQHEGQAEDDRGAGRSTGHLVDTALTNGPAGLATRWEQREDS